MSLTKFSDNEIHDLIIDNTKIQFISGGDIHGDIKKLEKYLTDCVKEENIDFIIASGDYLFQPEQNANIAKKNLRPMFKLIANFRLPTLVLGGNYEIPGISYDLAQEFEETLFPIGARRIRSENLCPGNSIRVKGFGLLGVEGSNPINGKFPGERSEEELKWALFEAEKAICDIHENQRILITHVPPYESGNRDKLGSFGLPPTYWGKHVGSLAIRSFIIERKPLLHICGHVHEGVGVTIYYHGDVKIQEDIPMHEISKIAIFTKKNSKIPITICLNHGTLEHWVYFKVRIAELAQVIAIDITRRRLGGEDFLSRITRRLSPSRSFYKKIIDPEHLLPEIVR